MENFTPVTGFIGGLLIGLAALIMLAANGRIAGVSGIAGGLLARAPDGGRLWRIAFVAGLPLGALLFAWLNPQGLQIDIPVSLPLMLLGGLLVGIGTRMGGGCTSGHGVCGIARFSMRSIVATATFMLVAALTVFLIRHGFGGGA